MNATERLLMGVMATLVAIMAGLILSASMLSGCAGASSALRALAPYAAPAAELAQAFINQRGAPPAGQCMGVPSELTPDPGSAYTVCTPGDGWLLRAGGTLRDIAVVQGEDLDEGQAICIPLPKPDDLDTIGAIVCRAPFVET